MSDVRRGRLLIVGASARAAAMSAIRSGFEPWAVDRFGDLDLRACAATVRVDDYPAGLERAISAAPPGPWLYTGALENRPELIDRLSLSRRLYGVGGESLRAVRDPFQLAAALANAGLPAPGCARTSDRLPRDGSWLRKPLASAGGCGVRAWGLESLANDPASRASDCYFQQRIEGTPVGALYVAADRRAELLGVTRQLNGLDWCGLAAESGRRFRYCGSIGPLQLNDALAGRFAQLGNALAYAFDLRGLFGVDAILADEWIWPVEVNPRYTASVEILERALGLQTIALHVAAAGGGGSPMAPSVQPKDEGEACCGKAILFAAHDTTVAPTFPDWCFGRNQGGGWPSVADIPAAETTLHAGQPIVTVLAAGANEAAVLDKLRSLATAAFGEVAGQKIGRPA